MNRSLNVLIAEDSENDTLLLVNNLKRAGFEPTFERVESIDAMTTALEKRPWDILVSDHSMPLFSPITALQLLKEKNIDIPVLIVSGTIEPQDAVAAMKAGASDFIMKDDLTRLIPAIERELREAQNRRARRMAEEKFLQAQKMECVGRLAGGVAHDFNNLLTAIMGCCDLLLENLDPKDSNRTDILDIEHAADQAALLTRQLLAFSRQQVVEMKILDLNKVLSNMQHLLPRVIGESVELTILPNKDLRTIKADSGQIEQVVMNLCVNARDAMPEGGKLTIKTENMIVNSSSKEDLPLPPGPYAVLSVTDTGTGMDKELVAKIFEPFFTTKPVGKGTGLGLSTVFEIAKQCGGHILVDTEPGRGSTFKILLPQVEAPTANKITDVLSTNPLNGSETLLLVEDDEKLRRLTRHILSKRGYRILEAKNAEEALKIVQTDKQPLDLLITDVIMPKMNGNQIAKMLHLLLPNLKVLYVSGYSQDIIAEKGVLKSGIHFLHKPYKSSALSRKIREVLDSKHPETASKSPAPL